MGSQGSKGTTTLKRKELKDFADQTCFDETQIQDLWEHFTKISGSKINDGVIDKDEFLVCLGMKNSSAWLDRVFELFDQDGNGSINFREFIIGLSIFSPKTSLDDKLMFSFKVFDIDGDGCITQDELEKILRASLMDNNLDLSDSQLKALVSATFKEADTDSDGMISFDEYRRMVEKHPTMLHNMTIEAPLSKKNAPANNAASSSSSK